MTSTSAAAGGGILIGTLCAGWMLIMGFSGWFKDPRLQYAFSLVIVIQIGVMIWVLRHTAAAGKSYGGQIWAGTLMSVVGGIVLFITSLLVVLVVFPHYFEELRAIQTEMLRCDGKSEAAIAAEVQASAAVHTPLMQAL